MATFTWNKGATLPATSLEASMEIPADVILLSSDPVEKPLAVVTPASTGPWKPATCRCGSGRQSFDLESFVSANPKSRGLELLALNRCFVFYSAAFLTAISTPKCTDLKRFDVFWAGNQYSFTTVPSRYGLDSPREFIFIFCKQQDCDIEGFDFPLHVPEFLLFSK
jgi:hypothetical protein